MIDPTWRAAEGGARGLATPPRAAPLPRCHHPGGMQDRIMPGFITKGQASGSCRAPGTLTYEAVFQTTHIGLGQSTCVAIAGSGARQ